MAIAAIRPRAHTGFIYAHHLKPKFSVELGTSSATHLIASKPRPRAFPASSLLVLCPGTSAPTELQMGFPGARLTLRKGHYRFQVSYTEPRADLVTFHGTLITIAHLFAHATVNGTVEKANVIVGTVTVTAKGCGLKASSYRAILFKAT